MSGHRAPFVWQIHEIGTNSPLSYSTYGSDYQSFIDIYVVIWVESDRGDTFDPRKPAISTSVTKS